MPRTDGAVCLYQGAPLFVHLEINRPGLSFSGAFQRSIETETGYLFPSMAAHGDAVLVAGQGHTIHGAFGRIVRPTGEPIRLGPDRLGLAVNANPVAVRAVESGWQVALVRDPRTIEVLGVSLAGDVSTVGWRDIPQTSQGITGWDGEALLMGDPPHRQIAGRSLSEATKVGSWWIGQDTHGERIVLVRATDGYAWQAFPSRTAQRPRFVILADGRFAITASDDGPVAEVVSLGVHDDSIGRPAPPPPPQKPEEPKEPPVSAPSPDRRLVKIVTDHWNASGIVEETKRDFRKHNEAHWKHRHATVLYEGFHLAYHVHGITSFGVYPKPIGTTRFQPYPDKPEIGFAEDVCQILDGAGTMFYKDIGIGFGGPTPSLDWGAFERSRDEDQPRVNPSAYQPPPRLVLSGGDHGDPGDENDGEHNPPAAVDPQIEQRLAALERRMQELSLLMIRSGDAVALQAPDGSTLKSLNGGSADAVFGWPHDEPGRTPPEGWESQTIVKVQR